MNKLIYQLPLLLGLVACSLRPQPTRAVADGVNPTLTAVAQDHLRDVTPPATLTTISVQSQPTASPTLVPAETPTPSGTMTYFWPQALPEGFVLSRENSHADVDGFELIFINSSNTGIAMSLRLSGGADADQYQYCVDLQQSPSEAVTVRGQEGCFPASTGGGYAVEWKENSIHYIVGGMGFSKELVLATTEQLESISLSTCLARLTP